MRRSWKKIWRFLEYPSFRQAQTAGVEADLVDEPGGLPNSHGMSWGSPSHHRLTYTKSWSSMTSGWFGVPPWLRTAPYWYPLMTGLESSWGAFEVRGPHGVASRPLGRRYGESILVRINLRMLLISSNISISIYIYILIYHDISIITIYLLFSSWDVSITRNNDVQPHGAFWRRCWRLAPRLDEVKELPRDQAVSFWGQFSTDFGWTRSYTSRKIWKILEVSSLIIEFLTLQ